MLDVVTLGELLIDFTCEKVDGDGYPLMQAHAGGAVANFLAVNSKFGLKTAFIGKVGNDTFGNLLVDTLTKNGIYGGMFVAGALAGALSKNPTVDKIIDSGLASIPKKSRLFEAISLVREWYRETPNWDVVSDKILEKYGYLPCEATINNMAMVALGIIAGELDYTKSITIATMCGLDTDCNAGTVGSIVGAAVGIDNIENRWIEPLNDTIKSAVACFGDCKISDICRRIVSAKRKADRTFA